MRRKLSANLVEAEIATIRQVFLDFIKPLELYLFGSAAEGKMTDQSDYDFLVVMKDSLECKNGMRAYQNIRSHLPRRPIDVLWMTRAEFEEKRNEGGIALVVFSEGKKLI